MPNLMDTEIWFRTTLPYSYHAAAIESGMSPKMLRAWKATGLFLDRDLADLVGLPVVTFRNRCYGHSMRPLPVEVADRLYRLEKVFWRAVNYFGAEDPARDWLCQSSPALENRTPLSLLKTSPGTDQVLEMLQQLDKGSVL